MAGPKFSLRVVSLVREVFRGDVESIYIMGDEGEYEMLAFHYPLIGAVPEGEIYVAGHDPIPLKTGVVMFDENNHCTVIIEEKDQDDAVDKQFFSKKK